MFSANVSGMGNLERALAGTAKLPKGNQLAILLHKEIANFTDALLSVATQKAPVKEGTLRGGATSKVQLSPAEAMATVTFGGQAADYASVQHEHDEFEHPKGGQAHFLHGAGDSAWDEKGADLARVLDSRAGALADRWLQRQIGQ